MTTTSSNLDVAKMPYIGRVVTNIDVGVALPKSGIKSFEDVRAKQYSVGASGGGSVPPERLRALRTAFRARLEDADFLAACERRKLMVDGATGEDIDEIVRETLRLPQSVANKVAQMMQ